MQFRETSEVLRYSPQLLREFLWSADVHLCDAGTLLSLADFPPDNAGEFLWLADVHLCDAGTLLSVADFPPNSSGELQNYINIPPSN